MRVLLCMENVCMQTLMHKTCEWSRKEKEDITECFANCIAECQQNVH